MKEKLTEAEIDMVEGEKPLDIKQFKNGDDIHFDYQEDQNGRQMSMRDTQKKKKKKKGKNKQKAAKNVEAIINDPDAEYPTSRVIKQADNGEVIVESLDEQSSQKPIGNPMSCLPNSVRVEEEENINKFWKVLTDEQRTELVKIDKEHMLQMFRNGIRNPHAASGNDKLDNVSHNVDKKTTPKGAGLESHNNVNGLNALCKCTNCGRKNKYIEEIVGNIYDEHYEDIMDFVKGMNKIDDLNAIPGLLFDGYHMLEEEYNLQKRQKDRIRLSNVTHSSCASDTNGSLNDTLGDSEISESFLRNKFPHNESLEANKQAFQPTTMENGDKEKIKSGIEPALIDNADSRHPEGEFEELEDTLRMSNSRVPSPSTVEELHNKMIFESQSEDHGLQNMFQKIFDPNLMEELKNRKNEISDQESFNRYIEDMKKKTDRVRDLKNGTKLELEKSVEILKNMGRLFSGELNSGTLSQGFSSFAEDLLKNDGKSFIDIMESLSGPEGSKAKMISDRFSASDDARALPFEDRDDGIQQDTDKVETSKDPCSNDLKDLVGKKERVTDGDGDDIGRLGEETASLEDVVDEEYKDEDEPTSDAEPEFNDKWIMQEIRRLFLMYVLQVFQERMKVAYKEKLCQERAQKFIEELEAEENAKRERELKKSRQKEKAKEKKRLQQQMKEEERHRKAEEQRQREEELIREQEAIKEEQRRHREEARQKKEEEKRKKIDEARRKEYEHQKREEQQKKEEEKRKRIEESKRKEEHQKKVDQQERKKEEFKKIENKKRIDDVHQSQQTKGSDNGMPRFLDNNTIANSRDIGGVNLGLHSGTNVNSSISLNRGGNLDRLLSSPEKNKNEIEMLETKLQRSTLDEFGLSSGISKVAPPYKDFYAQDGNEEIALTDQPYMSAKYNMDPRNSTNVYPGNIHRGGFPNTSEYTFPSVFSPSAPNILPTNNSFKDQHVNNLSPWSIENQTVNQKQSFQPFGAFAGDTLPQSTNENLTPNFTSNLPYSDPFGANGIQSSMWNVGVGRKSIWASSKVGPGIWSNNTVGSPMGSSQKNFEYPSPNEQILIRTAAYCAFQLLRDSNQLELGFAPTTKLYETTKQVLANPHLTLSQMLSHCRSQGVLSKYYFEYVYDEIGTVIHIKADLTNSSSQMQYPRFSQPSQTAEPSFQPVANPLSYQSSPFNQSRNLAGNDFFGTGPSGEFFNFDHLSNSVHNLWN